MNAIVNWSDYNPKKAKARYLVALNKVLNRDQIRLSIALFDDLVASGVEEIRPADFSAIIAEKVPGARQHEASVLAALSGEEPAARSGPSANAANSAAANIGISLDASTEVFVSVMNAVLRQVSDRDDDKVTAVTKRLPGALMSDRTLKKFSLSLEHYIDTFNSRGEGIMADNLPVSAINGMVDTLYTVCCDLCGPQSTDKYFNSAISEAERLPAAKQFNPRQLL